MPIGPNTPFLIGAAIGSGNTALAAERGGADFLLAINAGRLRNMGAPSIACMLPIFDATALTESFAREELLSQCRVPVLLGVDVWDATFDPHARARNIRDVGFAGAVNFPSCMHYSRPMQQILARAGRGIEREVEQLRAVQDAGLTAMFYCASRTQARLAADAGIDLICLNLGWNVGGATGHRSRATLEEAATMAREIGRLVKRIAPRTRFLLEGGPIGTADDLGRIVGLAAIDGYVGGSTIERLPLEASVSDQIDRFRQAGRRRAALDEDGARLVAWGRRYGFTGRSKAQLGFLRRLRALAAAGDPVLLLAEPGLDTAGALAALNGGKRPERPGRARAMVEIDAGGEDFPTRTRNLLFGARDGATTRLPVLADRDVGLVVIHAPERLTPALQRRLARTLQDGRFRESASRRTVAVAPRVVLVSTARTAAERPDDGLRGAGLDAALADRFAGWTLRLPPLRERIDDLPAIVETLSADSLGTALGRPAFSSAAFQKLESHRWPGNEAELRSVLGTLAGRPSDTPIQPAELLPSLRADDDGAAPPQPDSRTEKDRVVDALWRHGFNRSRTAAALGISRKTLYNKIKRFGLAG